MELLLAWTLLSFPVIRVMGVPYGSFNDLYDTNYEYEFGDNQLREEVLITKTPHFLSQPLELVVNEGHTVRLPCLVDQLEGFVLLWRKNEQIISVGDQILDRSESRIQLEEVENGNTLVISLAGPMDEAEYVCSVSAFRKTEIRHNVRIRVQPVITTFPAEQLTISEGDSATLSCHLLSGSPIPDIKWRRCEGESFPTGEKEILEDVIKLESVTRDDSGCYVCQADNGFADAPVTSLAMLVVEYPPTVHIQKTEDSAEEITITCTVESQPAAEVTWIKDGEKILNETKNLIINKSSAKNTLNLVALDDEDFGNYTCVAANKLGMAGNSVNISVKEFDGDIYENADVNANTYKLGSEDKEGKEQYMETAKMFRGSFSKIQSLVETATLGYLIQAAEEGTVSSINSIEGLILSHPKLQLNLMSDSYRPTRYNEDTIDESPQEGVSSVFDKEDDTEIEEARSGKANIDLDHSEAKKYSFDSSKLFDENEIEVKHSDNEIEEEDFGEAIIHYPLTESKTTKHAPDEMLSGSRYLEEHETNDYKDTPAEKATEKESQVLRGQYALQITLGKTGQENKIIRHSDSDATKKSRSDSKTKDSRSNNIPDFLSDTEIEVARSGDANMYYIDLDHAETKKYSLDPSKLFDETETEIEEVDSGEAIIHYPVSESKTTKHDPDKSDSRYLEEHEIDNYIDTLSEDTVETKSQVLRGQYSLQNTLGKTSQESIGIQNSDSDTNKKSRSFSETKDSRSSSVPDLNPENETRMSSDLVVVEKFKNSENDIEEARSGEPSMHYIDYNNFETKKYSFDPSQIVDENEIEVKHSDNEIEEVNSGEATIHYPVTESKSTKHSPDKIYSGSRYLDEHESDDYIDVLVEDATETEMQVLRGYSLQATIGNIGQGNGIIRKSDSDTNLKSSSSSNSKKEDNKLNRSKMSSYFDEKDEFKQPLNEIEEARSGEANIHYIDSDLSENEIEVKHSENEIEEVDGGEAIIHYPVSESKTSKHVPDKSGSRYLKDHETDDYKDVLGEDTFATKVLRGQYSLQTTLDKTSQENIGTTTSGSDTNKMSRSFSETKNNRSNNIPDLNPENETRMSSDLVVKDKVKYSDTEIEEARRSEANMHYIDYDHFETKKYSFDPSKIFDENEIEVKHSDNEIEELNSGEATIHYPVTESKSTKHVSSKSLSGSRYLEEHETDDYKDTPAENATETESQVLRGQYSLQATLGKTGQEDNIVKDMESQNPKNSYKNDETDYIHVGKKGMSNDDNAKNISNASHTPFLKRKADKRKAKKEEQQSFHPLQVEGKQFDAKSEVLFRGENRHEKGGKYVPSEENNRETNKKFEKRPMLDDYSYRHTLKAIENFNRTEHEAMKHKNIKRRPGPHPFRGLMLRKH